MKLKNFNNYIMKQLIYVLGIILLVSFTFYSCKKNPNENEPVKTMNDLVISDNFDWKTTKTIDVSITLPENNYNQIVKIFSLDGSELFYVGYANNYNILNTRITMPTSKTVVMVVYGFDQTYDPILVDAESDIIANFNGLKSSRDCDLSGLVTYERSEWGSDGSGTPGDIRDLRFLDVFTSGLTVGDTYTLHFDGATNIETYLSKGGGKDEVLTESKTNPPAKEGGSWASEIVTCMMNVHFDDKGYIGASEKEWKLKDLVFSSGLFKDVTVQDFLDMANTALGDGGMNGHSKSDYKNHAKLVNQSFSGNKSGGGETYLTCPGGGGGDDCGCDGGIFSLTMRYTGASSAQIIVQEKKDDVVIYTGTVSPNGEFTVTGGSKKDGRFDNTIYFYVDGVENAEMHVSCSVDLLTGDVYGDFILIAGISKNNLPICEGDPIPPVDPPAPPSEPPGSTNVNLDGCLAYEDLWPGKGDYDFNDLVIDYDFTVSKDEQDRVLDITGVFTVYAFGASFHNGFGFMLPNVAQDQVISVSGYNIQSGSIFNLALNGLEDNTSPATVIVYDDSYRILTHPGQGIGVNTEESAPYVEPQSVTIHMVFYENGAFASGGPITYDDLDIGNFNPFIIVNQDRGVEVHLRNFAPTTLADPTLFGTFHDDSDPNQGRYYVTSNNLIWGINIPVVFDYPQEKKEVVAAYNHFAAWAESSGLDYDDWYEDIPGYRTENLIYTIQSK